MNKEIQWCAPKGSDIGLHTHIINPKTNRCIKADGRIAQDILAAFKNKPKAAAAAFVQRPVPPPMQRAKARPERPQPKGLQRPLPVYVPPPIPGFVKRPVPAPLPVPRPRATPPTQQARPQGPLPIYVPPPIPVFAKPRATPPTQQTRPPPILVEPIEEFVKSVLRSGFISQNSRFKCGVCSSIVTAAICTGSSKCVCLNCALLPLSSTERRMIIRRDSKSHQQILNEIASGTLYYPEKLSRNYAVGDISCDNCGYGTFGATVHNSPDTDLCLHCVKTHLDPAFAEIQRKKHEHEERLEETRKQANAQAAIIEANRKAAEAKKQVADRVIISNVLRTGYFYYPASVAYQGSAKPICDICDQSIYNKAGIHSGDVDVCMSCCARSDLVVRQQPAWRTGKTMTPSEILQTLKSLTEYSIMANLTGNRQFGVMFNSTSGWGAPNDKPLYIGSCDNCEHRTNALLHTSSWVDRDLCFQCVVKFFSSHYISADGSISTFRGDGK